MGRFSLLPTSSSSSYRSISSTAGQRSGSSQGFPKKCFCGLDPVIRTSTTADNPARRFYGCRNYLDGGYHIMKWCDEAAVDEIEELKLSVADTEERIQQIYLSYAETDSVTKLQDEINKTHAAVAELKDLLLQKPSGEVNRGIELKKLFTGCVLLIVLLFSIFVGFWRS